MREQYNSAGDQCVSKAGVQADVTHRVAGYSKKKVGVWGKGRVSGWFLGFVIKDLLKFTQGYTLPEIQLVVKLERTEDCVSRWLLVRSVGACPEQTDCVGRNGNDQA
ncbi:hypothetical protein AMECASPLE_037550 [Ameca splendens]|uniref:Uncharacterized protein n=1 Tax=Ameca splendens TaxID=208324 RepID=A0ABV0YK34_9TELE